MTAIVHALSRTLQSAGRSAGETETLIKIAFFCAAGLLLSLVLLVWGVDLSPTFF